MKTSMITFALLFAFSFLGLANDSAYENAMMAQIEKLHAASTKADYQAVAHAFERIGQMNGEAWHPAYYAALAYVQMAMAPGTNWKESDGLLDKAIALIDKAAANSPKNPEIISLEGYAFLAQLSMDPGSRGQSLSPVVLQTLGKAMAMDATNPRAMALMAQMEYGMADFFGQGTEKACRLAKGSMELFDKEKQTTPSDKLAPTWGREIAESMALKCR